MRLPAKGWRQPARWAACAAVMILAVVTLGSSVALGSFTTATVTNAANGVVTGSLGGVSMRDDVTGATCSASGISETECPWSPLPLSGSAGLAGKNLTLTNLSPATSANGYRQQAQILSCAPRRFVNTGSLASSSLLARWGIERQLVDPWGGTSAARFDGVKDYATGVTGVSQSSVLSGNFSVGTMFRAAPGSAGGGLLSLAHIPPIGDAVLSQAGPVATISLRMNTGGVVQFRVAGRANVALQAHSGIDLRDGQWHSVVANYRYGATNPALELFVDGVLLGEATVATTPTGSDPHWFWQLGITPLGAIAQGSSRAHFAGDISGAFTAAVLQTPQSAAAMSSVTSAAAYRAAILNPNNVWMLGDDARSVHDTFPVFGGVNDACTSPTVRWVTASGDTVTAGMTFRASVAAGAQPALGVPAPLGGASQGLRGQVGRNTGSGWSSNMTGVEVLAPARYSLFVGTNWRASILWRDVVVVI